MAKELYLLRHAQAMDKQDGQTDLERTLDSIGLQNSSKMGINLGKQDFKVDIIISSPAARAQHTAELIAEQVAYDPHKIHQHQEVYEASIRTLLLVVNQLKNEWGQVLIVGHNPSITYLSEYLTDEEIGNVPTCGLLHFHFDFDEWGMVSKSNGRLVSFAYPDLLNF